MAENYGGPVWHASGKGATDRDSLRIARLGLTGCGDAGLGEWVDRAGTGRGIAHVVRRMTDDERAAFGVPEPIDIRGTAEEARRIAVVLDEAPHLRGRLAAMGIRP